MQIKFQDNRTEIEELALEVIYFPVSPFALLSCTTAFNPFVHDPRILLYDEPTTGLDPIICRHVDDLICDMREKLGVSSIVISHDIEGARRVADIVALLHEGRVVEQGPPEQFFASENPIVRQFVEGKSEGPIRVA